MLVTFKGFKSLNLQIAAVAKTLTTIGSCESIVNYLCSKFNLDRAAYSYWLCSGDMGDIAELVTLYLEPTARSMVLRDIEQISALNSQ